MVGAPTEGLDDPPEADDELVVHSYFGRGTSNVVAMDGCRSGHKHEDLATRLHDLVQQLCALRGSWPFLLPTKPEYMQEDPPLTIVRWSTATAFSDAISFLFSAAIFWVGVAAFVLVQLGTLVITGDSFFGMLTGGVVESVSGSQGLSMKWHMCAGSAMWSLAFVQIFLTRLRKGELAWVHRWCGRIMLILWFLICGPTAAHLSLYCSPGPYNLQVTMSMFSVVSLDTTVFASYYLWRGWLVALRRKRGVDSIILHGRAMRLGVLFTMLILWQRPIQLVVITLRKVLLAAMRQVHPSWEFWHVAVKGLESTVLSHHAILSYTTAIPFGIFFVMMFDGPRSLVACKLLLLGKDDVEELFGSPHPSYAELLFWRLRTPVYILIRGCVTSMWTADPLLTAAAP